MEIITDEAKFFILYAAAENMREYIREQPDIAGSPWGFDRATLVDGRANAEFSCVALSGWGRDRLTVSAVQDGEGWVYSHSLHREA